MTTLARQLGHKAYRDRKAADPLTDRQLDAIVIDAIEDGLGYDGIQARLDEARALIADGCQLDERGRLQWPV